MSDEEVGVNIRAAITAFVFTLLLGSIIGGFVTYFITGILITAFHINIAAHRRARITQQTSSITIT